MSIKRRSYYSNEDGNIVHDFLREQVNGTIVKWYESCDYGFILEDNNGKRYLFRREDIAHSEADHYPVVGQRVFYTAVDKVDAGKLIARKAENCYIFVCP